MLPIFKPHCVLKTILPPLQAMIRLNYCGGTFFEDRFTESGFVVLFKVKSWHKMVLMNVGPTSRLCWKKLP